MSNPGFIEVQRAFAAHIRNPEKNPPPEDVVPRRMQVYVRLFHRNVESFLANGFPVAQSVLDETQWRALVRGFIHRHAAETPYFMDIGQEFMAFLDADPLLDQPDWLLELCHYEWVRRSLKYACEEIPEAGIDPCGDLQTGHIVPSPLLRTLCYRYWVNEIGPDRIPKVAPDNPTWLIVCRRRDESVRLLKSNALTHRLLEILQPETPLDEVSPSTAAAQAAFNGRERWMTGNEALAALAVEFPHIDRERLRREGSATLARLREAEVLLGVRTRAC